jgi:hypothetical protein
MVGAKSIWQYFPTAPNSWKEIQRIMADVKRQPIPRERNE